MKNDKCINCGHAITRKTNGKYDHKLNLLNGNCAGNGNGCKCKNTRMV